ncbi:MAG: insulinase family protein [Bacteroidaceae bacterium]|nr:insulinase family protein [Bacteroidaceae bacterium]
MRKLLSLVVLCCSFVVASAQNTNIPLDPAVRKGTLPNGLTYYLRYNNWPEKRANFYIAQKVGSMQEEENQRGLAHFLEHMCFNGTKNFPGDRLKKYLETIGVKFGENLNAYTSFDETVYNIDNVNVEIAGALDSCLLILHDWSHDLLLEGKEIDKERGVINEEWRMRSSSMMRMYNVGLPQLYPDSKYGDRLPIGTMDVVMNFPHDDLRAYYKKWYRPDLQALVIVGDIDLDQMEQKIQQMFADIQPAPADAAERIYYPVPDNPEPIVTILKDKEQEQTIAYLMWKDEAFPREMKSNPQYYILNYAKGAMASMFRDRIREILQKENAPFLNASFGKGKYLVSDTKDAFNGVAVCKENQYKEGIQALYREILRAKRHGFTASEFERFKAEFLSQLESAYLHRDKVQSGAYVNEYVQLFLNNEPAPGIEWEYTTMNMVVPQIRVDLVNQIISQMPDSNFVIAMFMPDKEGVVYPTKEELLSIVKEVEGEQIDAYVEEVNNDPLIAELPAPGTVKSIKPDIFGARLITLSNGIKIHVKQTDFSPNQIAMRASSWGGTSLYSNDEYLQASNANVVSIGGWGNYSSTNLNKRLAGIQASAGPSIGDRTEGLSGSCVKKDFETMLQLTYLCFTAPRKDQEAFNSLIQRSKANLENAELDPQTALQDTIAKVLYNNNVRALRDKPEDLDRMNYDRILEIYKERFADAGDFEFYIVGDCNADSIAPLLAKYLGALPSLKSKEKYKVIDRRLAKGEIKNVFEKHQETPNSIVIFLYHAPMKDNLRNELTISMLDQAMEMVYTETVREDEGGAYGVPVNANISDYPEQIARFQVQLPTAPEKRERMTEIIYKGIDDMVANGPSAENLQKIKEYMLRSHTEALKNNNYWMNALVNKTRYNMDSVTDYEKLVNSITAKDIQNLAKQIFKSGNRIEVGMTSPLSDVNK